MDVHATPAAAAGPIPQQARLFAMQDLQVVPTKTPRAPVFQARVEDVIIATVPHEFADGRQSCTVHVPATWVVNGNFMCIEMQTPVEPLLCLCMYADLFHLQEASILLFRCWGVSQIGPSHVGYTCNSSVDLATCEHTAASTNNL